MYCHSFLDAWPDHMQRRSPHTWLERFFSGEHEPRLALCNAFHIVEGDYPVHTLIVDLVQCGSYLRPHYFSAYPELGDEAVVALADSPILSDVHELCLYAITTEGALALARSSFLSQLIRLELDGSSINAEGLLNLVESPGLPKLAELDLFDCGLGADEIAALATSPGALKLEELYLGGENPIGHAGSLAMATSPYLAGLKVLNVNPKYDGGAGQPGLRALVASPHLSAEVRQTLETLLTPQP